LNHFGSLSKRFDGRKRIFSIDGHMTGTAEMPAEKRVAEELFLCGKPELKRKRRKNDLRFSRPSTRTRTPDVQRIILDQTLEQPCCMRPLGSMTELATESRPMIPVYRKIRGAVITNERTYPILSASALIDCLL
jgi:hypothetical protein